MISNISPCPKFASDGCIKLINKKSLLFDIDKGSYNDLVNITFFIGNYERFFASVIDKQIITKNFKNLEENNFIKNMSSIRKNLEGLIHKYNSLNNILTKKSKVDNEIIESNYSILNCNILGTGNLTLSLILEMEYQNSTNSIEKYNSVAKIYPINLSNLVNNDRAYTDNFKSGNDFKKLDYFMDYLFMREAMIGCWIKNILINKNVSSTFACIYDVYKLKGLPLSQEDFNSKYSKKYNPSLQTRSHGKRWLHNIINTPNQWNIVQNTHFGFIEMEKLDVTLFDHYYIDRKNYNLGIIFEILYSKLVLMFFGNVYMTDDHANNIMLKKTNTIRHYKLKRRNTIYDFYIQNHNIVKFIDFERFEVVKNRNLFLNIDNDRFLGNNMTIIDSDDEKIRKYLVSNLKIKTKATVDNFCELMARCLPDQYKKLPTHNTRPVEHFYINLDIHEDLISENFIGNDPNIKNIDKPHTPQNMIYTPQNIIYTKENIYKPNANYFNYFKMDDAKLKKYLEDINENIIIKNYF